MTAFFPASIPHEDSVNHLPVGDYQSLNIWSSDDRACRTTNLQEQCSAGKAPCPNKQIESNKCTTATNDAVNATTGTTTKAGSTSYTTTDLINGGCAAPALIVSMEDLMQATTNNFLLKAVAMLGALEKSGVLFKVVTSDGAEYGTLPYVRNLMDKKVRRKYGSISMHIDPYIRRLKQGDVAVIEMPSNADYSINDFQARVSSRMCSLWGAGNGTCHRNENTIEVLRIK